MTLLYKYYFYLKKELYNSTPYDITQIFNHVRISSRYCFVLMSVGKKKENYLHHLNNFIITPNHLEY